VTMETASASGGHGSSEPLWYPRQCRAHSEFVTIIRRLSRRPAAAAGTDRHNQTNAPAAERDDGAEERKAVARNQMTDRGASGNAGRMAGAGLAETWNTLDYMPKPVSGTSATGS